MKTSYVLVYNLHLKLGTSHILIKEGLIFLVQTDFFYDSESMLKCCFLCQNLQRVCSKKKKGGVDNFSFWFSEYLIGEKKNKKRISSLIVDRNMVGP